MKNILTIIAVLFITVSATAQTTTANATLNIKLNALQSIQIHPGQTTVGLDYSTLADYENGVISENKNHVEVFSTGSFVVSVHSNGDLTSTGTADVLEAGTIQITPSEGNIKTSTPIYQSAYLNTTPQPIITSVTGGNKERFDIKYKGGDDYVNKATSKTYTAIVTYTVSPN